MPLSKSTRLAEFFLATDQQQYVDQMRSRYGKRLLVLDAIRSTNSTNPFHVSDGKGFLKGKEVLMDCLLLSQCDHLAQMFFRRW